MKFEDLDPLGWIVTISLRLNELEKLVSTTNNAELKSILEEAKRKQQEFIEYARQ